MTTPLSDPLNVQFELVDDEPGFTEDEAYAFLVGADATTFGVPKITVAAADVHDGAMIALLPSEVDARRLALENFEEPEQLHLTLVYLGDAADFSPDARQQIINTVKRYATDAVTAKAFSVNVFNPDAEEPALVLGVGNDGGADIEQLRSNIYSAVGGLGGMKIAENHTPWIPHVTLAYSEHPHELVSDAADRVGPVTFDRIRVAFGGDNTDVPLGATVSTEPGGDAVSAEFQLVDLSGANLVELDAHELALAVEAAKERDVNVPGGGHDLRNYWVRGPGAAKIGWGTDGSFARCVTHLGKYVTRPQGLCAEYHHAATGEWPRGGNVPSSSDVHEFRNVSPEERSRLAQEGKAMPDGSYPIANVGDLHNAIQAIGRAGNPAGVRALIRKRAKELGAEGALPESWSTEMDEFDITDDHGHVHGGDGKFISKPGSDLDKLKSLVGVKAKYPTTMPTHSPRSSSHDDLGPTRAENVKRLKELEDKLNGDEGLDHIEMIELKRLRQILGGERDGDSSDDEDGYGGRTDYALTAAARKKTQTYADEPWEGTLVVEGVESGDSRLFGLGSLDWAALPMPLQYQPASVGGHNGSVTVGEITHVARRGNELYGWGNVFGTALNGEHGDGIRTTMKVGGVSVDVDSVKDAQVEMVYGDGDGGNPFAKPEMTIFHQGRVRGATLVAFPAFVEAKLKFTGALAASAEPTEDCGCDGSTVLTASSHTITIPNLPPAHWFNEPTDVESYGALTITDEGRVFGVVAPPNTTHRSVKRQVPRNVDFTRFHKGETIVEGGNRVVTGVITAGCGHAPTENYGTLEKRREHYDNSCSVLANVRVGYAKDGGIWCAGALNPGADPAQVAQALGCGLSLDVQPHPDRPGVSDFLSAHLVPVPGFPMARAKASVVYSEGTLVAAAVPVEFNDNPTPSNFDVIELVRSAKDMLAQSIGRDPATRKRDLMNSLREQ